MLARSVAIARLVLLIPLVWLLTDGGVFHYWAALMVFLACGLGGLVDSFLPRWRGPPTALGGLLDVMADRLLTVVVVAGLIAAGLREGLVLVASLVLIARDVVVATLNEALHEKLDVRVSGLEKGRVGFQVLGFGFLIAPNFPLPETGLPSHYVGGVALIVAAVLALITLAGYASHAARTIKAAA
jgi:phosphatidylglycerophosphate synthase